MSESDHPSSQGGFVYHLHRGSSLLLRDKVEDAKVELEHALQLQPKDAKSQDLLAGVYYRLGVYPRALDLWARLVVQFPESVTLRVNLALVYIKTGQSENAQAHLERALDLQPEHERAWGYLGLILWRKQRFSEARDAFEKAKQPAMMARMDEAIRRSSPETFDAPPSDSFEAEEHRALRDVAAEALDFLDQRRVSVDRVSSPRKRSGAWKAIEVGDESSGGEVRKRTLDEALSEWSIQVPPGATMIRRGDVITVDAHDGPGVRVASCFAIGAELEHTPLDGLVSMCRVQGAGQLALRAEPGLHGDVLMLEQTSFFVRESRLLAFDSGLRWKAARFMLGDNIEVLVQLQGTGQVAIAHRGTPTAIPLLPGAHVALDPTHLVGWRGRVFPAGGFEMDSDNEGTSSSSEDSAREPTSKRRRAITRPYLDVSEPSPTSLKLAGEGVIVVD